MSASGISTSSATTTETCSSELSTFFSSELTSTTRVSAFSKVATETVDSSVLVSSTGWEISSLDSGAGPLSFIESASVLTITVSSDFSDSGFVSDSASGSRTLGFQSLSASGPSDTQVLNLSSAAATSSSVNSLFQPWGPLRKSWNLAFC